MANIVVSVALAAVGVAVTPSLLVGLGIAAILGVAAEALRPLHAPVRTRRRVVVDLTHAAADRAVILPLVALALAVLGPAVRALTPDALPRTLEAAPAPAHLLVVFCAADLANYLIHRALHRVPVLWRLHAVHHSSEQLDWLATARVHPFDLAINITAVALPAYALGEPAMAPWLVALLSLQPFLVHADVDAGLRRLSHVVVTPAFHHWHHAAEADAHDRNFGMFLSVWDRLFGTAIDPGRPPATYGIEASPLATADYLGHLLIPLRRQTATVR